MEHQLYHTILLLAGGINMLIAFVLLYSNVWFLNYDVYRRARQLVALCYIIFAVGFMLHAHFDWRTTWPAAASALSVSYFHIGAVLFGWSHTSLMRPDYLTHRVYMRDTIIISGFDKLLAMRSQIFIFQSPIFNLLRPRRLYCLYFLPYLLYCTQVPLTDARRQPCVGMVDARGKAHGAQRPPFVCNFRPSHRTFRHWQHHCHCRFPNTNHAIHAASLHGHCSLLLYFLCHYRVRQRHRGSATALADGNWVRFADRSGDKFADRSRNGQVHTVYRRHRRPESQGRRDRDLRPHHPASLFLPRHSVIIQIGLAKQIIHLPSLSSSPRNDHDDCFVLTPWIPKACLIWLICLRPIA